MKTVKQVFTELKKHGSEQTRKIMSRHGVGCAMFGVKIADLKKIAKQIKGQQDLALELYETGNYDAMYLAGMVADGSVMTKQQIVAWAKTAPCAMISEYTVPWIATESKHARTLAMQWIKSKNESLRCSGWCTYAGIVATQPDEQLDLSEIETLVERVAKEIHEAPNRVRYPMNGFVIAVGSYVKPLLRQAKKSAKAIGAVDVDMGETSCKVPLASTYIAKVESMGRVGKKRKTLRC